MFVLYLFRFPKCKYRLSTSCTAFYYIGIVRLFIYDFYLVIIKFRVFYIKTSFSHV